VIIDATRESSPRRMKRCGKHTLGRGLSIEGVQAYELHLQSTRATPSPPQGTSAAEMIVQ